uniref:Reverse transcriptase Ty1/copia-type domain-containing protein n=1 Tax=Chromera velia CCMP2878 TaxID=1169474 RepID=A0A0G4IEA5_9ALVE|eukprot:Cvel_13682.t1-p1 / transcript=Cvel_13682.t1 / gene=Cvel_13682 / organism=Chromera_velia_CCMP2878 / gene_product=Copia protein, putative / transcript_product=Copia protein, putative / location=Cvel_scaffold945:20469-23013(+) / protein_length=553 / sequence_SO=supercontig / SO=protein_coding / is_pseudo=false
MGVQFSVKECKEVRDTCKAYHIVNFRRRKLKRRGVAAGMRKRCRKVDESSVYEDDEEKEPEPAGPGGQFNVNIYHDLKDMKRKGIGGFLEGGGIATQFGPPLTPEVQAFIERVNDEFFSLLNKVLFQRSLPFYLWPVFIPGIANSLNEVVHGSTGLSPNCALFGVRSGVPPVAPEDVVRLSDPSCHQRFIAGSPVEKSERALFREVISPQSIFVLIRRGRQWRPLCVHPSHIQMESWLGVKRIDFDKDGRSNVVAERKTDSVVGRGSVWVSWGKEDNQSDADNAETGGEASDEDVSHPIEKGVKAITLRWVRTWKLKEGKRVAKSYLIARGFQDSRDWSVLETYSSTADVSLARVAFLWAVLKGLQAAKMDVSTAFLQAPMKDAVWLRLPSNLPVEVYPSLRAGVFIHIQRAVYGLKDALKVYTSYFKKKVSSLGWTEIAESILVRKNKNGEIVALLVMHVDDLFIFSPSVDKDVKQIQKLFNTDQPERMDNGELYSYVGISIRMRPGEMLLDQSTYIEGMVKGVSEEAKKPLTKKDLLLPETAETDMSLQEQ